MLNTCSVQGCGQRSREDNDRFQISNKDVCRNKNKQRQQRAMVKKVKVTSKVKRLFFLCSMKAPLQQMLSCGQARPFILRKNKAKLTDCLTVGEQGHTAPSDKESMTGPQYCRGGE